MVTNENEFLGVLIKCKNQDNCCNVSKVAESAKMGLTDCSPFIESLEQKNIIYVMDLETIRINPIAFSVYESPQKKAGKSFFKLSVSLLKFVITYILGIVSGLVIAYFTHKLGWQ